MPKKPTIEWLCHYLQKTFLDLDFHLHLDDVRLYNPATRQWVLTPAEAAEARADQESARADQEAIARRQETARAETSEAEAAALRAKLARLRNTS